MRKVPIGARTEEAAHRIHFFYTNNDVKENIILVNHITDIGCPFIYMY